MKKLYILLIVFLTINIANAQTFTNYNTSNCAMSSNYCSSIAIDTANNVWVSYNGYGISKFNGTSWYNYNTSNSGLLNNQAGKMFVDKHNNIWVGSYYGISRFNGISWTTYTRNNSGLPCDSVYNIVEDSSGNMWFGTGHGISKFNGTSWTTYFNFPSAYGAATVSPGADHSIWFADSYTGKVLKYDVDNNWTIYTSTMIGLDSVNGNSFQLWSIAIDHNNILWLSQLTYGLYKFDGTTWTLYHDSIYPYYYNRTKVIKVDDFNNKWLGEWNAFSKFNDTTFVVYPYFLQTTDYFDLAIDLKGNKWIATQTQGIGKLDCDLPSAATSITGLNTVTKGQGFVTYKVPPIANASSYVWSFPNGFVGTSTADSINVYVDYNAVAGAITVHGHCKCGNGTPATLNVTVLNGNGIDELSEKNISVYPNPAKDKLTIESNINTIINYDIVNLMGQTVYSSYLNAGKTIIDISAFAKGIYSIKLYSDKGNVVKKFVKE